MTAISTTNITKPRHHTRVGRTRKTRRIQRDLIIRTVFYVATYALTLIMANQLMIVVVTAPMLAAIVISIRWAARDKVGYVDITSLIFFLFFVIVPLQQVDANRFIWGELRLGRWYPTWYFFVIQALAIFFYICLIFAAIGVEKRIEKRYIPSNYCASFAALIAIASFIGVVIANGSIHNLLLPRYEKDYDVISPLKFLPLALLSISISVFFASIKRVTVESLVAGAILLALLLVSSNPINTPRFFLVGTWIPVILILFPIIRKPLWFYSATVFAALVALPVLSVTTRFGITGNGRALDYMFSGGSAFVLKNLNVFEMACEVIRYVETKGYTGGAIMVSTVGAFIPRAWWPSKPIVSSFRVGENVGPFFTNINLATPWFMDGYMDGGFFASLLYSALAGYVLYRLGKSYSFSVNGNNLYLYIYIANLAILVRGTLAGVFTIFIAEILFLLIYKKLFLLRVG